MTVFLMSAEQDTCIRVQAGQKFALEFVSSPGTGYGWALAVPLDEKLVTCLGTKNKARANGILGASEYELWQFLALTAGRTEISLKYVRPWENDADPVKKHVFKVTIQ